MDTSSTDLSLINDCLRGNEDAWSTFVDRFSGLVYYSIQKTLKQYSKVLDQEDIEDIYNGVFLSFIDKNYRKLRQFEGKKGCTLSSWVRLITIRHTIDFMRRQRHHVSIDSESNTSHPLHETIQDDRPSVQEQMETSETGRLMNEAIEAQPSSDRLFMELYYTKELPPEEIAVIMNISVSTVYSKKNRIREKLEKTLRSRGHIA